MSHQVTNTDWSRDDAQTGCLQRQQALFEPQAKHPGWDHRSIVEGAALVLYMSWESFSTLPARVSGGVHAAHRIVPRISQVSQYRATIPCGNACRAGDVSLPVCDGFSAEYACGLFFVGHVDVVLRRWRLCISFRLHVQTSALHACVFCCGHAVTLLRARSFFELLCARIIALSALNLLCDFNTCSAAFASAVGVGLIVLASLLNQAPSARALCCGLSSVRCAFSQTLPIVTPLRTFTAF